MGASDLAERFVTFRGGFIVPAEAYVLLLDLEARGFTLRVEATHALIVSPPAALTPADCSAIRRWKWHLVALLAWCATPGLDAHLFSDAPVTEVHHA